MVDERIETWIMGGRNNVHIFETKRIGSDLHYRERKGLFVIPNFFQFRSWRVFHNFPFEYALGAIPFYRDGVKTEKMIRIVEYDWINNPHPNPSSVNLRLLAENDKLRTLLDKMNIQLDDKDKQLLDSSSEEHQKKREVASAKHYKEVKKNYYSEHPFYSGTQQTEDQD